MEYDELLAMAMSLHDTPMTSETTTTSNTSVPERQMQTEPPPLLTTATSTTLMGQAEVVDLSNDTEVEVNPVLNQKLQQFIEISGAERTAAQHLLEVSVKPNQIHYHHHHHHHHHYLKFNNIEILFITFPSIYVKLNCM